MTALLVFGAVFGAVFVLPPSRPIRRPVGVERIAARPGAHAAVSAVLARADIGVAPDRALGLWAAASLVGAVFGFALVGVEGSVVGALAAIVGVPVWVATRGDRRRAKVIGSLPELLEMVARGLRGGADLRTALGEGAAAVPGAGDAMEIALARVHAGARLGDALDRWVVDLDHPDAALVRAVMRLGDATGSAMAASLDRAASTLRERAVLRQEIRSLTSQTRASSTVVALAPIGFLFVVAAADRETVAVLFTSTMGRACLLAGLVLDGAGLAWMRHITGRLAP